MLRTAEIDSILFRHLTGKATPSLVHPTNSAFDAEGWRTVIDVEGKDRLEARDVCLVQVAMLIGLQNAILRTNYTADLFAGFTPSKILILAVANANRGFLLIRDKSRSALTGALEAASNGGRPLDFGAASQMMIEAAEGISAATPDDIHTALIDSLPHWFALAAAPPVGTRVPGENLGGVAQHASAILSLEHAFRTVWQEALWGPWKFGRLSEGGCAMMPENKDWKAGWRIWSLRDQTLHIQSAMLNRQIKRITPGLPTDQPLPLTVVAMDFEMKPSTPTIAAPSAAQSISHRMVFDTLDDTYTITFADQDVGALGVTCSLLSRVVILLHDLVEAALPTDYDPPDPDWAEMERLACRLPIATIAKAIADCLGIDLGLATSCIDFLISDPDAGLSELFRIGLWHRPLVRMPDGETLLVVAGPLTCGSAIRRTERWLQSKSGDDLTKTPNGLVHEARVRDDITIALAGNNVIAPGDRAVSHLPRGRAKEEIDLLVRIGEVVLVCEIKCLLAPAEPSECYNYVRKLEKAAEQASRKAAWLEGEQTLAHDLLGGSGTLRMLPLAVVNQSAGVGLNFDSCQITDAHFLRIVMGSGEYHSGAKFNGDAPPEFNLVTLYTSREEAEAVLPHVFADNLGVKRYRDAVVWTFQRIPLAGDGGELMISYPVVDEEAYFASGPFAGEEEADGDEAIELES